MANYVSSHTGAEIDSAVDKAAALPTIEGAVDGQIMAFSDGAWVPADLVSLMIAEGLYTPNLMTDPWSVISKISASGNAANYYAVGDVKPIVLDGTVGTLTLDEVTAYVYILGFNHNSTVEGNGITFGTFKVALEASIEVEANEEPGTPRSGTSNNEELVPGYSDVCLVDSNFGEIITGGTITFNMNHWGTGSGKESVVTNHGGWAGCDMRYDILGSTDVEPDDYGELPDVGREGHDPTSTCATNPVPNTLMSCLPADLRAVMKPITKYTDNVGGGNGDVAANVTATVDYLPLLSEHEVQGAAAQDEWRGANAYEVEHQAQYAYYAAGNSKIKNKLSDTSTAAWWWVRSPNRDDGYGFCLVRDYGIADGDFASISDGVSPLFKV